MSWAVTAVDPMAAQAEIAGLWRRNLPDATRARFEWLYGGRGQSRSWLLRDAQAGLIGSAGLMPRRMQLGDALVEAGSAIDLNVDSAFRSAGPALALQRAATEPLRDGRLAFIYGLPSPSAVPVLKRAGYREVGVFRRWAKPLRTASRWKKQLRSAAAGQAVGWCADRWLQWTSAETTECWPRGHRVVVCRQHNARFDRLWDRRSRGEWIVGERTADYLNWRYALYPDLSQETIGVVSRDDDLEGYAVVGETDGAGFASDLWFADDAGLRVVLQALIRHARTRRWSSLSISLLSPPLVTAALYAFGFRERSDARPLLVMPGANLTAAQHVLLFNATQWHITRADSDTDV